MNRDARRNQLRVARLQLERRVDAGAQIDAGRAGGRVLRQREIAADARIEDANLQAARGAAPACDSVSGWHVAAANRC